MDRIVIDTEGQVSEPLECGHDWMLWETSSASRIKACKVFETHSWDRLRGGPLKLLQPAPLCPDRWENGFQESGQFLPAIGVGPWRGFIGPTTSEFGCMSFEGRVCFNVMIGLGPGYPQCGPYEASEGIYPGCGQRKNWGRARVLIPLTQVLTRPIT